MRGRHSLELVPGRPVLLERSNSYSYSYSNAGAHKSKKPPQQMLLVVGWLFEFRAARLFEDLKLFFKVSNFSLKFQIRRVSASGDTWCARTVLRTPWRVVRLSSMRL